MFYLKITLIIYFFMLLFLVACTTTKNLVGNENGWTTMRIEKDKTKFGVGLLFLTVHNAEEPTDTIPFCSFIVNGIDLPCKGNSMRLHIFPNKYTINARVVGLKGIETVIHKKMKNDIYVDFYMKYYPSTLKVQK